MCDTCKGSKFVYVVCFRDISISKKAGEPSSFAIEQVLIKCPKCSNPPMEPAPAMPGVE